MKKDYPYSVCVQCGLAANTLTCLIKYGQLPKLSAFTVSTYHDGVCDVCERYVPVTEARDFFYPDFSLLSRRFKNSLHKAAPISKEEK